MENEQPTETSWQDELLDYIDDDFEKKVLNVAMKEKNPGDILLSVKEIIREKLHEDKKLED